MSSNYTLSTSDLEYINTQKARGYTGYEVGDEIKQSGKNYRGQKLGKVELTKTPSNKVERVARAVGAVASVATVVGPFTEFVQDEGFKMGFSGKVTKPVYVLPPEGEEDHNTDSLRKDPSKSDSPLRYDRTDSASITAYMKSIKDDIEEADGNYFYIEKNRSSFLFVPKGDWSKAYSCKMYKAKDGSDLTSYAAKQRAVRSYSAALENIDEEWEKKVDELAKDLQATRTANGKLGDATLDDLRKEIRERRGLLVLDMQNHSARIYGQNVDLKTNIDTIYTGTSISLSEDTTKRIDEIHDANLTKQSGKLEGRKPFKNAPIDVNPEVDMPLVRREGQQPQATQEQPEENVIPGF